MRQYLPLVVTAFLVGSLFRLYHEFDVGFFRMFGTIGVLALGLFGARLVFLAQVNEGLRRLQEALAETGCAVLRGRGATRSGPGGRLPETLVVRAGKTLLAVVTSPVAHHAGRRGAQRAIAQAARRASALAAEVAGRTPGVSTVNASAGTPVRPVVVLLRRRLRPEDVQAARGWKVDLTDMEEVRGYLAAAAAGAGGRPEAGAPRGALTRVEPGSAGLPGGLFSG